MREDLRCAGWPWTRERRSKTLAAEVGLQVCRFVGPGHSNRSRRSHAAVAHVRRSLWLRTLWIVVLAGLACGCRVITSDAGGLREGRGGSHRAVPLQCRNGTRSMNRCRRRG